MLPPPHITVCICTYKRPHYLQPLLQKLVQQKSGDKFDLSVVIVDNDKLESARGIVSQFSSSAPISINYYCEPEQNIARARNRALEHANGEFIAFFDDDQLPTNEWLATLLSVCEETGADGVLGPVKPIFEVPPPAWVTKGGFCERASYSTGFEIDWRKGRTGNVLFRRSVFSGEKEAFRPAFLTGEDQDFFRRMIEKGHVFRWCEEAIAYEIVPPTRWKRSFMLRRALLRGQISLLQSTSRSWDIFKSLLAMPAYLIALPFLLFIGHGIFMKYLVRTFDHAGRLLALVGLNPVKDRYVTE